MRLKRDGDGDDEAIKVKASRFGTAVVLGWHELISLKLSTVGDDSWSSVFRKGEGGKAWKKGSPAGHNFDEIKK
jgi:hypothetical protein